MKKKPEYTEGRKAFENFDNAMDALMKVPHSQIKAELDVEKKEKAQKRTQRGKRSSSSGS